MKNTQARILLTALFAASLLYSGCRKSENGSNSAAGAPEKSQRNAMVRRDNPCSILLPQEVEEILGVPVMMREIVDEQTCSFPLGDKPGKESPQSQKSSPAGKQAAHNGKEEAETMAKEIAAGMAGKERTLVVKVYWDNGRQTIMATRMAGQLLGGKDSGFESLPGIGDEAWLGPMASNLTFVKGQTGIEIDLRMVPNAREPGIRLAKLIASRLQ